MQDDNTAQNSDRLKDFSDGILPVAKDEDIDLIISGQKFRNEILKDMVVNLREEHFEEKDILDLVVTFDDLIERGELTNDNLEEILAESISAINNK